MASWFGVRSWRKRHWVFLALIVALVLARALAPTWIAATVRRSLDDMGDGYRGRIDGAELSVLRAEVVLLNLTIEKTNGRVPVPFMRVERFILGTVFVGYWPRTTLRLAGLKLNWVDAADKAAQQWGPHFELRELREQLPFELASLVLEDAEAHLRNFEARPGVDVYVQHFNATWRNLQGCLPPGWTSCDSTLRGEARVMGASQLDMAGHFDRRADSTFELRADLHDLRPAAWNPALLKYAELDVQRGRVDLNVHYRMHGDAQRLVLVPRLHDVEIAGGERERTAWGRELAAGLAAGFFERRSGEKAIVYKRRGGSGAWSLIDWDRDRQDKSESGG